MAAGLCLAVGDDEIHLFLQRFERGLAQQDRNIAGRRAFDHGFGRDAVFGHQRLYLVDVQRSGRQVVDVRTAETDNIGNQTVRIVQLLIHAGGDAGLRVPAERFQRFVHEILAIGGTQPAVRFCLFDESDAARRKYLANREDLRSLVPQFLIRDQVQPQKRCENAEWIRLERLVTDWTEGSRVDRHAGDRQVIVTDRLHPHDCKETAYRRQFVSGPQADRAMTLVTDPFKLSELAKAFLYLGVGLEIAFVHLFDEVEKRAVGRNFFAVHP